MAPDTTTIQPQKSTSRRRNKKSTADAKVEPPAQHPLAQSASIQEEDATADGDDAALENIHIKELQKYARHSFSLSGVADWNTGIFATSTRSLYVR